MRLRMSTECPQLTLSVSLSLPHVPLLAPPSLPQTAMAPLQSNPLPSRRCPVTAMAPPQSNPLPSRRSTTAMALPLPQLITAMVLPPQPPPRLLMNTSLPVRMSPPPSPTPPPMTPASGQTSQTRSGLRTVLAPASLTATARQASRTRSSQTTAAWTATAAPPHMTPPQCPVCQVMRLHCEESEKNILLETLRKKYPSIVP